MGLGIKTNIDKIAQDIIDSYAQCDAKGATMPLPADQGAENLAATIDTIPGGAPWDITNGKIVMAKGKTRTIPAQTFGHLELAEATLENALIDNTNIVNLIKYSLLALRRMEII